MNLSTHICTQLLEKAKISSQITLDDDFIVRDNKPDVVQIIYSRGDVLIEDVKVGNQVVWITGRLRFSTLYQSDDENHRLESVAGEVPFQEKVIMDEVEEGDDVVVDMSIEDLSMGMINSRKLLVRAVVNVMAKSLEEVDAEITCGALESYEQKFADMPMLCLVQNSREQLRMQREMLLPNSRSNIGTLVFYQVDFRNEEITLQNDGLYIKVDAQIWVLYRSESDGEYECYETSIPLSSEIETGAMRGDEIFWVSLKPLEVEIEPRTDYDGENRMLGLDLILLADVQIYREENCQVLQDAYALDRELFMDREELPVSQLLMKNEAKLRLMEQQQLGPGEQKILQICGSSGDITIDRVQKRENGLQVEGVLNVHILYNTTDDRMPFAHTGSQLFFEQFIEIQGFTEGSNYWLNHRLEQLQVNLLDNSEYEVKAVIEIDVLALGSDRISNITSMEERELDTESLQRQPGMIGYIRREGEDLWEVAKKYHATTDNMIEVGNKVLVVKQVR